MKSWNAFEAKMELFPIVRDYFNSSIKANDWFEAKNPLLGHMSPNQMLLRGRHSKLRKIVENMIQGNNP
jgi:hypothetical protein